MSCCPVAADYQHSDSQDSCNHRAATAAIAEADATCDRSTAMPIEITVHAVTAVTAEVTVTAASRSSSPISPRDSRDHHGCRRRTRSFASVSAMSRRVTRSPALNDILWPRGPGPPLPGPRRPRRLHGARFAPPRQPTSVEAVIKQTSDISLLRGLPTPLPTRPESQMEARPADLWHKPLPRHGAGAGAGASLCLGHVAAKSESYTSDYKRTGAFLHGNFQRLGFKPPKQIISVVQSEPAPPRRRYPHIWLPSLNALRIFSVSQFRSNP